MKLEAYNYQCSPLELEKGGLFTEEDKIYREEALEAMERHLEIVDGWMTCKENVSYPQGSEMTLPFKEGGLLRLLRLNARKRKKALPPSDQFELNKPYLKAKLLYAKESVYVMSLQNVTILPGEVDWEKVGHLNEPSCIVILDNREGQQLLLIEDNGAFSSTKTVCKIFFDTFKCMFLPEKLNVSFKPHYSTKLVWEHMEVKYNRKIGIKSVKFHFDYPNMADDVKLLGHFFSDFGMKMNAEMDYTIKGQHNQPLTIDPRPDNRDADLVSIFEYGGHTGNTIEVNWFDNSKQTYNASKVGISTLVTTDSIQKKLGLLMEEARKQKYGLTKMDIDDDNGQFKDELSLWLKGLNNDDILGEA